MGTRVRPEVYEADGSLPEKYRTTMRLHDAHGAYNPDDRCFYCSENLSGEAVLYWAGNAASGTGSADLHLHPGCFIELTTRLFRDLHAIQCVMDYRVIQNASPRPEYPPREERSKERWVLWNRSRNSTRDLGLVRQ